MNTVTVTNQEQASPGTGLSLKLFIVGGRPESALAVVRLRQILRNNDLQSTAVQIVDIQKDPILAKEAQVVGIPALVKEYPLPRKVIVGDLSDAAVVLEALGLSSANTKPAADLMDRPQEPMPAAIAPGDPETIRVMLINFSFVVGAGIKTMLAKEKDVELVEDAFDEGRYLLQLRSASEHGVPVHVVFIEIRPGDFDGLAATKLIKKQFPDVSVILISEQEDYSNVIEAIRAGAGGYMFLKDVSIRNLSESIHWIVEGGTRVNTALLRKAVEDLIQKGTNTPEKGIVEAGHLTEREMSVLRIIGNGASNREISEALGISLDTAKKHTSNIVKKLEARNRTHAAIIAAQAGIVSHAGQPKADIA